MLDLNGFGPSVGGLNGAGLVDNVGGGNSRTLTVGNGNAGGSFAGVIQDTSGSIALTKVGSGLQVLSASNGYNGGTTVSGGTLQLGNNAALGSGGLTANNGTLDLAGFSPTVPSLNGQAGTITNSGTAGSTLTVNQSTTTSFNGSIANGANPVALVKMATGSLSLGGSSNYSGGTTLANGTLVVANPAALGAAAGSLSIGTGTLEVAAGFSSSGPISFNNANSTIQVDANQLYGNSGAISGTGGLNQSGGGTLELAGTGTLGSSSNVTAGLLQVDGALTLPVLNIRNAARLAGSGAMTLTSDGIYYKSSAASTFAGALGGAGAVEVDSGSLTLSGAGNTYNGGTTITGGTLALGANNALPVATVVTFGDPTHNGTLDLAGFNQQVAGLAAASAATAAGQVIGNSSTSSNAALIFNAAGSSTFAGMIQDSLGGGTFKTALEVSAGTLTLTGNNSFRGGTTINTGVLQLGSTAALPNGTAATVNGTLDLKGFNAAVGNLSGSGTIDTVAGGTPILTVNSGNFQGVLQNTAGSLALYKTTGGTLTLNAASTFAGGTTMNAGMLVIANTAGSALGSGTLTLNGGILAAGPAGGSIAGLVQAGSAAHTVAPGAGLSSGYGTLNLNGGLGTNANTTLAFNVYNAPQISGIYVGDLINLNGSALTVSGGSIAFVGAGPTALGDYRLIANLGGSSTNVTGFSLPAAPGGSNDAYTLSTSVNPGNLDLVVASAATFSGSATWIATGGSAVWSNSGNWADNSSRLSGVPGISLSRTADTAAFNGTDSAPTITLDVSPSLAALSFSGTNYTLSGSGTLTMNGGTVGATIAVAGGTQSIASAVRIAGGNLLVAASSSGLLALSGSVSDDGGRSLTLTGDGSGQLVLGGVNSYTGGTYVEQGTLVANDNGAIPDQSGLIVGAGGTFLFDPTVTGSALAGASHDSMVSTVPEPGTIVLLLAALWSAAIYRRFSKR